MIGDWDTTQYSVAKLASRVGYVFQNPDEQLFSKDVGAEVAFGPKNLGFDGDQIQAHVKDALELTELSDKTETNPYDLSATWRKMVALALQLLHRFRVAMRHQHDGHLALAEILFEAGLPESWLHVVTGSGSDVALAKTSYGSWAKSLHAPQGSTVTFRATDASGATAVQSFAWMSGSGST